MRTYAIVNRKGGVGKTTTAVELAYDLATCHNQRTLLIDADSQANATSLLAWRTDISAGLAAVMSCDALDYIQDVIMNTDYPNLDLIPATEALGDIELECTIGARQPHFGRLRSLLEQLAEEDLYDRVVIDCPPYYSVSCIAALSACDSIIIPAGLDAYSTIGMSELVRQIDNIRRACPTVSVAGVLITQYHRCDVAEDAVKIMREDSPVPVYQTIIRRSDKATESSWAGRPVAAWSPFSGPARDYRTWVTELLSREEASKNG